MSKTIKIAELAIDSKQLISELQKTKKEIDSLSAKQKDLKKNGDTSSKTFIEQESRLKALKKEYNANSRVLNDVKTSQQVLNKELNRNVKSLEQAEQQNKALRKARANLNTETEEGKNALGLINEKIDQNTVYMKSNQDEQVQLKMNVGNYKDELLQATGASELHAKGLKAMTVAQKVSNVVVGKSTGAMKVFKIALASTGVGLLVLALGSLISYFTSTQEGIDKVNKVLTPLSEIFYSLIGVVQDLGGDLVDSFSNPKEAMTDLYDFVKNNLINRFKAFGVVLEGIKNLDFKQISNGVLQAGTGVENLTDKISEAGKKTKDFFSDAINRGSEIERLTQELSKSEADFITQKSKLNKEFEQQKKLSDDTTKSTSEREEAARKALLVQEEISKMTTERIKKEAELLRLKQQANDTSDEDKKELAEKLAEIDEALAEEAAKTTEAQNKLNSLVQEGETKRENARQKAIQKRLNKMIEEQVLFSAKLESGNKSELQKLEEKAKKELEILDFKLKNKLISQTEYETEKQLMENEIEGRKAEKKAEKEQQELDSIAEFNERKKALEEEIYLEGLETEQEREEERLEREEEKEEAEIEKLNLSTEKKDELKLLLQEKYLKRRNKLNEEFDKKAKKEQEKRDKQELEAKRQIASAKLNIASSLSGLLNKIAGDDAAAQQALLLFEKGVAASRVIFQTQVANAKALAAAPLTGGQPFVTMNNIQMGISLASIAAQTIQGFSKINKDSKENKKFARGGILKGRSHAMGGIQTPYGELEGDEAIINKKSTMMFKPLLSAINEAGGGQRFDNSGILNSLNIPSNSGVDYDLLASKIASANMSLPNPIVGVNEINDVNNRVNVIENLSEF